VILKSFFASMSITSKPVQLVRFRWDLSAIPAEAGQLSKPFVLRTAGPNEIEEAMAIVLASYNLDPEWSGCALHIKDNVLPGVKRALTKEPTCLFVQHGNRIIGASVYDCAPEENEVHLVSGACVQTEYRNRGIGGALLASTLEALKARGLTEAFGHTRPNSPSAKYLCPKFGGTKMAPVVVPSPASADAA